MLNKKTTRGFTLIEVMIVVAILGIIAAFAYASYSDQVMRSNRSDAKATLNDTAQRLQRCYTTYSAYDNANCGVYTQLTTGASKVDSAEGFYEIEIEDESATTYTLTATAVAPPQTNDEACDDEMELNHIGQRSPEECW